MKSSVVGPLFTALAALTPVAIADEGSAIDKVVDLLSGMEAKITKEGEAASKAHTDFMEFCDDRSANLGFDIKTETAEVADLKAVIGKESAIGDDLPLKIDELAASIAKAEADLDAATKVRAKEAADFAAEEKELLEIIDMLDRAITVLQREMAKSGASMLEIKNANTVAEALDVMVKASMFSTADASRITSLLQNSEDADSNDVGA